MFFFKDVTVMKTLQIQMSSAQLTSNVNSANVSKKVNLIFISWFSFITIILYEPIVNI